MAKMKDSEIQVGKAYVKRDGSAAREVVAIVNGIAHYRQFSTLEPSYLGTYSCEVGALARWAEREATPEEHSMLNPAEAERKRLGIEREMAKRIAEAEERAAKRRQRRLK